MAANFDQLKDRIPRILTTRERFLEQQRCIVLEVTLLRCCLPDTALHDVQHSTLQDREEKRKQSKPHHIRSKLYGCDPNPDWPL